MHDTITLPGLGGSGDTHWQTIWERDDARFMRFQPASWDQPDLDDWEQSLERAVRSCATPPVLVAHSLACLLVAHWAARFPSSIAGAFLVAVPDPDGANFPMEAAAFKTVPDRALPFPSLVIASGRSLWRDPCDTAASQCLAIRSHRARRARPHQCVEQARRLAARARAAAGFRCGSFAMTGQRILRSAGAAMAASPGYRRRPCAAWSRHAYGRPRQDSATLTSVSGTRVAPKRRL
jgi:predicted alpha/beta hydrolase family esterase